MFLHLNMKRTQDQGPISTSTDNWYKIQARLAFIFDGIDLISTLLHKKSEAILVGNVFKYRG